MKKRLAIFVLKLLFLQFQYQSIMNEKNNNYPPSVNSLAADKIRKIYNSPNWKSSYNPQIEAFRNF